MALHTNSTKLDGAELFSACLKQATLVIKQLRPSHLSNATPDSELDVRDLTTHMLGLLQSIPFILSESPVSTPDEDVLDDALEPAMADIGEIWEAAADADEAIIDEIDLEDTIMYNDETTSVENILTSVAGELLIHAWDLGEAIGMPVRFNLQVAETVIETTIIPNSVMLDSHAMFTESISPPSNADLQSRLLALFGRSYGWRTSN